MEKDVLDSLERVVKPILDAPLTYAITTVIICMVMWRIFEWHYSQRLKSKDSLIADFQIRSEALTPKEAENNLNALKNRIEYLEQQMKNASEVDFVEFYKKAKE